MNEKNLSEDERDRLEEYYELMKDLSEEHDADNARLVKGEIGPKIVLEFEDEGLAIRDAQ